MAGPKAFEVEGVIGLSGLGAAANKLKSFTALGRGAASSLLGMEASTLAVGAAAGTMAVGLGVGAAATLKSISSFGDFDAKMTESLAIMGDVSSAMEDDMAKAARNVARTTEFSAEQAAESYFFLASAGLDAKQSIAALPQVAKFAQAGQMDMAQATDLSTDAQSALGLTVDDAAQNMKNLTRVTDVLVKANTLANASVEQFSQSLTNKAGARLRQLNKDMEEGVAALALFADQGVKASLAGNRLNILLRDLPQVASKNADAFQEMGINIFDAEGNMRSIAEVSQEFTEVLGPLNDAQKAQVFQQLQINKRLQDSISLLIGGSDKLREYERNLMDAGGTAEEVADKQLETLKKQLGLLGDEVHDLTLAWGGWVTETFALADAAGAARENIRALRDAENRMPDATEMSKRFTVTGEAIRGMKEEAGEVPEEFEGIGDAMDDLMETPVPLKTLTGFRGDVDRPEAPEEGAETEEEKKNRQEILGAMQDTVSLAKAQAELGRDTSGTVAEIESIEQEINRLLANRESLTAGQTAELLEAKREAEALGDELERIESRRVDRLFPEPDMSVLDTPMVEDAFESSLRDSDLAGTTESILGTGVGSDVSGALLGKIQPSEEDKEALFATLGEVGEESADKVQEKAGPAMARVGGNLVQSLASGTFDAKEFAIQSALSLASVFLPGGQFLGALGIASPSRVTMQAGRDLVAGLAGGIEDETTVVDSAVRPLTDRIATSFEDMGDRIEGSMDRVRDAVEGADLSPVEGEAERIMDVGIQAGALRGTIKEMESLIPSGLGARAPSPPKNVASGGNRPIHVNVPKPTMKLDTSEMPPARNPFEAARDQKWQQFLRESIEAANQDGFQG